MNNIKVLPAFQFGQIPGKSWMKYPATEWLHHLTKGHTPLKVAPFFMILTFKFLVISFLQPYEW